MAASGVTATCGGRNSIFPRAYLLQIAGQQYTRVALKSRVLAVAGVRLNKVYSYNSSICYDSMLHTMISLHVLIRTCNVFHHNSIFTPLYRTSCCVRNGTGEIPMENAAIANVDILCYLVQFVDDTQFLFVAPISRAWRTAWGERATVTSCITPCTSVSSFEHGLPRIRCGVCNAIAGLGSLELLKCARQQGFPWSKATCALAAKGGHLEVLQWDRENGCPWDHHTCGQAGQGGHLRVLQWARQKGCPWNEWSLADAAAGGHLDLLRWARENGCPWYRQICFRAAQWGHLTVLQWARENGCDWDPFICSYAARGGHLDVLQ